MSNHRPKPANIDESVWAQVSESAKAEFEKIEQRSEEENIKHERAVEDAESTLDDDLAGVPGTHGLDHRLIRLSFSQMRMLQIKEERADIMWKIMYEVEQANRRLDRRDAQMAQRTSWIIAGLSLVVSIAALFVTLYFRK